MVDQPLSNLLFYKKFLNHDFFDQFCPFLVSFCFSLLKCDVNICNNAFYDQYFV
ncbi:hypothetical protein CLAVI_000166 [Candidatus Clavichlamydia salmonicola]|nr:hypothetical protein [Candidatus Clavichlamydia salmonicola]